MNIAFGLLILLADIISVFIDKLSKRSKSLKLEGVEKAESQVQG